MRPRPRLPSPGLDGGVHRIFRSGDLACEPPSRTLTDGFPQLPATSRTAASYVLLGLILLAATVRFGTLGAKGFWGDETQHRRPRPPPAGPHADGNRESRIHPPALLPGLVALGEGVPQHRGRNPGGPSDLRCRPGSGRLLDRAELASARAATIAAGLVAVNPFLVWYSQEARSYSLLTLLSAIALLLIYERCADRADASTRGWAIASALALATHYFAAFLVLPEAVILVRSATNRRVPALAVGFVGARRRVAAAPGAPATSARSCRLDQQGADPRATSQSRPSTSSSASISPPPPSRSPVWRSWLRWSA